MTHVILEWEEGDNMPAGSRASAAQVSANRESSRDSSSGSSGSSGSSSSGDRSHSSYQRGREDAVKGIRSNPYIGGNDKTVYYSYDKGYEDKTTEMSWEDAND